MLLVAFAVLAAVCVALAILPHVLPRREPVVVPKPASWAQGAGEEFAELSEAARCDLIFAVAALDDEASSQLLERALDDSSESVALAAARALVNRGRAAIIEQYLAAHPGERTSSLRSLLEILD